MSESESVSVSFSACVCVCLCLSLSLSLLSLFHSLSLLSISLPPSLSLSIPLSVRNLAAGAHREHVRTRMQGLIAELTRCVPSCAKLWADAKAVAQHVPTDVHLRL